MPQQSVLCKQLTLSAIQHLEEGIERIGKCLSKLDPEQIWRDHNKNLVSVGNLILHLQGNVSQYIVSGMGKREYHRQRDTEFTSKPDYSAGKLFSDLARTMERVIDVIEELDDAALTADYQIQGFHLSGTAVLMHVVEHFSYHVGQITFVTKLQKNVDTGYYAGLDLNKP